MKYKGIVLDIDGTITPHISSWRYIHENLKIWQSRASGYQQMFEAGEISYKKFCELDAAEWRGLKEKDIEQLFCGIDYAPNVKSSLGTLKTLGFKLCAVSTGLQYIPERINREIIFDCMIYNRLTAKNGVLTGEVEINLSDKQKGLALARVLEKTRLCAREVIGVGDSEGDIALAENCGYFIAFNSTSPLLSAKADYICKTKDFKEVLDAILNACRESGLS